MRRTILALTLAGLALGTTACPEKGPMEKAGEKIDEAVDEITHPNEGALEKAGRKIDEGIGEAKEAIEADE